MRSDSDRTPTEEVNIWAGLCSTQEKNSPGPVLQGARSVHSLNDAFKLISAFHDLQHQHTLP